MYRRLQFTILLCMFLSICQLVSAADVTTRNLVARGNIQYRQLNYADALTKYDDAIERDSKYALAHNNRGLALHKLSKLEEAADAIRSAIQLDSDEAAFHLNLGKIYATAKDYDLALDEFEEALKLDPDMTEAIYNQVWVLDEQGEFLKAAELAKKLLEMDGRPPCTDMLNGIVSAHDGDAHDLVAACLRPDDLPQLWRWLSDLNHSLGTGGNKEMSEEEILGLREAMRLLSTEQFSQAREQLITVTSLANQSSAQSPIPYWLMAVSWLLEDNEEKADEEMEKAADLMARVFLPESDSQMELIINEDNVGSAPVEMSYLPGSYLVQVRESREDDPQIFTGIISLNAATYLMIDPSKLAFCVKGDVNNDGEIKSNDAIRALRFSAELEDPTPMEKCAADMNDDGQIKPNDAIIILRIVAGLAAPDSSVMASAGKQTTITLNEAHGVAGESIKIPVWFDNTDILAGGDICIAYDSSVLHATDVSTDSGVLLASNLAESGAIRIAFAYARGLSSRMLAEIHFDILADDVSPLEFRNVELYDSYALPINPRKISGQFISWAIPPENNDLLQNYPNPFNPDTWIPYQLKEGADVTIRIYSATGELVKELYLGYKPAGLYVSSDRASYWDGKNEAGEQVASGVYFYSIQAGEFTAVKKLIVLK